MAETAGLAVGVVALAGLLNNTIECFEFVQLGRAFEKDFKTAQLRLDSCQLRLSRWGASLGLNRELQPAEITTRMFGSEDNVTRARDLLSQILELFEDAEGLSAKFKNRSTPNSSELALCSPQIELNSSALALHKDMRKLVTERRGKTTFARRARWALYEEKRHRRLLEDINDLMDTLVGLFPANQTMQERLCEVEATTLGQNPEVSLLQEIASKQDQLLESCLAKAVGGATQGQHVVFSGNNNQGSEVGFNSGSITNSFGSSTT